MIDRISSFRDEIGCRLENSKSRKIVELSVSLGVILLSRTLSLPSTIFPYFVLASFSFWLRRKSWCSIGLVKPQSWLTTISIGVIVGVFIVVFAKVGVPILFDCFNKEYQPAGLNTLGGNLPHYLALLFGTWILAAHMEEMVFRGYFLNRIMDIIGERKAQIGTALVFSSIIFALAHGLLEPLILTMTFLQGLILGTLYLCHKRNLWYSIIAHGTGITVNITFALFSRT